MAAVRHIGFPKIWFLNTGSTWAADFPSLYQTWRKKVDRRRNMAQNRNPRWRSRSLLIGLHLYANPMHSFEDMMIWIFCRFGLKCLFTDLKFWFLGVRTPKRDWSSSRPPKGTSLAETALTCQFWCRSVHWCDLSACWRNQKRKKKSRWKKLTVANWVFAQTTPTLTQRYVVLYAGWSSGDSYKFQVSSKSVERFARCGGSKFGISYT